MASASSAKAEASQTEVHLLLKRLKAATKFVVTEVQKHISSDLIKGEMGKGRFRKLAPDCH